MSLDQLDHGELKALIREVIEEQQAAQAGKRLGEA